MREQIAQAVYAKIKTVDLLGFATRDTVQIQNLAATQFPVALIESTNETREVIASSGVHDTVMSKIEFKIQVWTQNPYMDSKRNALFTAIEAVLVEDRKLGGAADEVVLTGIVIEPQGSEPYGRSTITVEVSYCYQR
jgi:hypothetical protein